MKTKGFTLIETVIYVALLALLMGGTLAAVYQILQSQSATSAHDAVGMEGSFVLRKLAWAMSQAESITMPSAAQPSGLTLSVLKFDGTTVNVIFNSTTQTIEMNEGTAYEPITTSRVSDPAITFTRIQDQRGVIGIEVAVTLSGKSFYFKKYLHR